MEVLRSRVLIYWIAAGVALVVAVGLVALAVSAALSSTAPSGPLNVDSTLVGEPAPAFSLPDYGGGNPVDLSTVLRRGPTIVNFFASWCTDCRQELRAFGTVSRQLAGKIGFVGVDSTDTDPARAAALLREAGADYPMGLDPNGVVATNYLVEGLPTTVFIDADGRIAGVALGAQTVRSLDRWAAELARK